MPNITDDPRYDKLFDKSMDMATSLCIAVMGEGQRLRLVYRLDVNHYLGAERAQLLVEHLEPVLG